jgi:phosphotransferase system HPr (HPr) family protein
MKKTQVSVKWKEGLHLRPAAKLVKRAQSLKSSICLRANQRVADARSILSIVILCGTLGTVIDIEASGQDEDLAIQEIVAIFESESDGEAEVYSEEQSFAQDPQTGKIGPVLNG